MGDSNDGSIRARKGSHPRGSRWETWYPGERYDSRWNFRFLTHWIRDIAMSILTKEELVELTGGLKQGAAQIRWIERALGIKAPRRIDGTPMIM